MKRYDAMRLSGTILLTHLALCAAFLLLLIAASGSTSTFTFRSPYGLVLGLLFIGLPAFAFGWGLRSAKNPFDKKLCWNAAMVLYVLNAAAFLLALTRDIEVVVGSTNPAHIQEAVDGESIRLSKSDWYELYRDSGHFLP